MWNEDAGGASRCSNRPGRVVVYTMTKHWTSNMAITRRIRGSAKTGNGSALAAGEFIDENVHYLSTLFGRRDTGLAAAQTYLGRF